MTAQLDIPALPLAADTEVAGPTAADLDTLRRALAGTVTTPDDDGWDAARAAWNLAVDQRPDLVVHAGSVGDLVATVRFAARHGLRVATQGTGHGAPAMGELAGAVLLRTDRLRGVEVDPVARRARVEAGAQWQDVTPLAGAHGLAALAGSAADVGVVGYSLGGGIGWLARRYGLACNSVLAADVVTADGELLRVDAQHHPELFWALRGGGGSFGVVAALEFALYPVRDVVAGMLLWPIERAAEVLHTWREWTTTVPDTVTSVGRILRFPPLPELPPFLSGREIVVVEATFLEDEPQANALLAGLRALEPELDTFRVQPAADLALLHMDPPAPVPGIGDHRLLAELTAETVDAMLEVVGAGVASPLLSVEFRHLGGALATSDPDHGAFDTVEAAYVMFGVGLPVSPEVAAAIEAHLGQLRTALEPWDAGREYLNFAEQRTSAARVFGGALDRLLAVRATYDPEGRFQANHPVA